MASARAVGSPSNRARDRCLRSTCSNRGLTKATVRKHRRNSPAASPVRMGLRDRRSRAFDHPRQHEAFDCHAFKSNRQEECVQMPVKTARSATRSSFGLPELLMAIHTSRQSCSKAGKSANICVSWESSGESRLMRCGCSLRLCGDLKARDIAFLLGGSTWADGTPADPTIWQDWLMAVRICSQAER
jgi:hypothetical protein